MVRFWLFAFTFAACSATARGQFATVRFLGTGSVEIFESEGQLILGLTVDGPGNYGGVGVVTVDGTATAPDDYAQYQDFVLWEGSDSENKYIYIDIVDDGAGEDDESFTVQLSGPDGLNIGEPSAVTVTLRDGAPPDVYFLLDDRIERSPSGEYHWPLLAGEDISTFVQLREFPLNPTTVLIQVGDEATPRELVFDDIQTQAFVVQGTGVPEGETFATRKISIVGIDGGATKDVTTLELLDFFGTEINWSNDECTVCAFDLLLYYFGLFQDCDLFCALDLGFDCPVSPAKGSLGKAADTLRDYRDQVLSATGGGQYYVDLYAQLNGDIGLAMLANPGTLYDIYRAAPAWLDALGALLAGNGDTAVVTSEMQESLLAILAELRTEGSSNLDEKLGAEIDRIGLDSIAGMNLDEFQAAVEAAGASVSTRRTSWSALRSMFKRD